MIIKGNPWIYSPAKKAGLLGLLTERAESSLRQHHYRHWEDITPESRFSALQNNNFPTILEVAREGKKKVEEGEEEGKGEKYIFMKSGASKVTFLRGIRGGGAVWFVEQSSLEAEGQLRTK